MTTKTSQPQWYIVKEYAQKKFAKVSRIYLAQAPWEHELIERLLLRWRFNRPGDSFRIEQFQQQLDQFRRLTAPRGRIAWVWSHSEVREIMCGCGVTV